MGNNLIIVYILAIHYKVETIMKKHKRKPQNNKDQIYFKMLRELYIEEKPVEILENKLIVASENRGPARLSLSIDLTESSETDSGDEPISLENGNNLKHLFSEEELKSIKDGRDTEKITTIEGDSRKIHCFDLMYRLINDRVSIADISRKELLIAYKEFELVVDLINCMFNNCFDPSSYSFIDKCKEIIYEEIHRRREEARKPLTN